MAIIGSNYAAPVMVNGFLCKNCTEIDLAKAHIDPQHPAAGPFGANAKADPSLAGKQWDGTSGAVTFGGSLSDANSGAAAPATRVSSTPGSQLDLSV